MKKFISIILMATALGLTSLNTGCVTTQNQTQQQKIESGLLLASQLGGTLVLVKHPELRPGFVLAIEDLRMIENSTNNVGVSHILVILQRLNVEQLESPEAVIYITSGILLLNQMNVQTELPLEQSNNAKGMARAIRTGLEVAVSTVPPTPIPSSLIETNK